MLQSLRSLAAGWRLGPDHECTDRWSRCGSADDRYIRATLARHVYRRITPIGPRLARTDGLQSTLVWGCGSQEAIIAAISFNNGAYQFLGSAKGVSSSRPRFCEAPRAAVVKAGRHCGGASGCVVSRPRLDDGEPGAKLDGRDDRSCSTTNVILDWAVDNACGNTASPCIRSGTKTRYPNPSCTVKAKPSKDGTHLRSG